jgi:hypothetical protein
MRLISRIPIRRIPGRLLRLSRADRRLLARTFIVVASTRAALSVGSLNFARRVAHSAAFGANPHPLEKWVWAVTVAGRYLPRATCLTQALAGQALLACSGYDARVEIGVAKAPNFEAHSWIVCCGEIVLGGDSSRDYLPILALEPASAVD